MSLPVAVSKKEKKYLYRREIFVIVFMLF